MPEHTRSVAGVTRAAMSKSSYLILSVTLAYVLASGAILTWTLWSSHKETIVSARATLGAFTTVSDNQAGDAIQRVEQTLEIADGLLAHAGIDAVGRDPMLQVELRHLALSRPLVRWLRVVGVNGTVVFASHAHVGLPIDADRALFDQFGEQVDQRLAFVLPRATPEAWGRDLALARPWRHPNGRLAGVIMAALDRRQFEREWTAGSGLSGTSISLFSREGVMLLRSPAQDWAVGQSFAGSLLFSRLLPASAQGSYRQKSILDGEERLVSYRMLGAYPSLLIGVSRTMQDVLAPWRQNAWLVVFSWLVTSGVGATMILTLMRRLQAGARRLENMRQINQQLVNSSVDLILVVSRTGEFVEVSPSVQAILGYSPSELIGRIGAEFVIPEDLEKARAEMRLARRGHVVRNFECRYHHKDGHIVLLGWAGRWSDEVQLHFFIGRDMTEQKAMEGALRQAQKMEVVGQLTGGVAHDFNNLLTVVLGSAEILVAQFREKPQSRMLAEMIASAATRGAALTRSLLAFSRKQALEPRETDGNKQIYGMEPLLRRTLGEQVQISLRCAAVRPNIMIDPAQLETALMNLAINARDAMPQGGLLTIATEAVEIDEDYTRRNADVAAGRYLMISVADTGTGMAPEVLAQVFEPFFTTKDVGKGSGLGLSMVYGFVKQSTGHVKIYSELGLGTVVRLYLPSVDTLAAEAEVLPFEAPEGAGETILVVEDDEGVRRHVVGLLEGLGYKVKAADDGPAGLAILRQPEPIDLLFTDVVMPGCMNGAELARQAQQVRPRLKVLYTSGYTDDALTRQGRLAPGVELLTKPYRRHDLAARLRKLLESQPSLRASL